ncbi:MULTISPECIES: mannose-6-phosphate isomerase, class I [unclassified Vibrio]|uniref:mannose-6-phosphate isomerase, class I n=1 Tax=unclassified Vibrio TaxID=2614977 RepID=UPI00354DA0E6
MNQTRDAYMNVGGFYKLSNIVQDYPWGSRTSIPELFGIENQNNQPMAEIWMGAHPKASSSITFNGESRSLNVLIEIYAEAMLGSKTYQEYAELPYLLKVLAAEKALSIQVHPTKEEASAGFEMENKKGIDINAFDRNYKDANHKPELVYALTPFLAMNGFRPYDQIVDLFTAIRCPVLQQQIDSFSGDRTESGLSQLFSGILHLNNQVKDDVLLALLAWARESDDSLAALVLELNELYPNDIGLLAPLMLNVIQLSPGQAMFLHAGTPHAYLKGTAIEIMANSDNVLRAGLTPKYIDVPELVNRCNFKAMNPEKIFTAPIIRGSEQQFPVPVGDFSFSVYSEPSQSFVEVTRAEIWFAIDSDVRFEDRNGNCLVINKGESVFIPYATQSFSVTSLGRVARAF